MMIRMANIWRIRRNNRLNIKKKSEINKNNMKFLINIIFGICCKLIIMKSKLIKFTNIQKSQFLLTLLNMRRQRYLSHINRTSKQYLKDKDEFMFKLYRFW